MADWTPQSRAEEILFDTINGEPYDGLPQSRIEELLLELKEVIEQGGGGGGGTDNYNSLKNLPQINGITLKGNKTTSDLGLPSVAANPTGEAVGELMSIDINGSKYSIPESSEYEETTLWTGSGDMTSSFTATIAHPYTDYDALRFEYESGNGSHNYLTHYERVISKETLSTPEWFSLSDFYFANGAGVNSVGQFTDTTHLSVMLHSLNWFTSCTLTKIVGIKYGNGVCGEGGGAYTTTVLFTNGASGDTTFQLSSAYTNFDAIAIYYSHFDGQDSYEDVRTYPTSFLNSVSSTDEVLGLTNDVWYYYFSVYSTTEFRYVKSNAGYITDIIGIKYGSNSGGGAVTGVKGSAESTYRTGNVDISASNIGLGNVDNTSDLNKPISTATQTALNGKVDTVAGKGLSTNDYDNTAKGIVDGVTSALAGKVSTSSVGSANGVAELDANGRVPSSQLPSYVDDVLEYADLAHFPATGETGKIYIAEDTNKTYRWSGSGFVEISESLALGETSSTAYAGNKGKANADAITAIKDGTNLDSFADVEDAFNYLTFEGTQADWNLLSTAEKKKYKQAIFTDDYDDNPVGNLNALNTTDKTSCVSAINEVADAVSAIDVGLTNLNSRVVTSGNTEAQSVDFKCRSGYACISVNAFVPNAGCFIFDIVVSGGTVTTKDHMTGAPLSSNVATVTYSNGILTVTFTSSATYTAIYQTPLS